MVHIETRKGKCETYDEDEQSSYWMLGIGTRKSIYYVKDYEDYLDRYGYAYKRSLRKAQLFELTTRCQRDLPSYMKYDLEELVQFARARGLISGSRIVAAKHRAKLEAALERADDNATFRRFFDLPAELRTIVYGHYCAGLTLPILPRTPAGPVLPPLLRASRQVYQESRPVYYECTRFPIFCSITTGSGSPQGRGRYCQPVLADTKERRLFRPKHFRLYLHLYVDGHDLMLFWRKWWARPSAYISLDIDLVNTVRHVTLHEKRDRGYVAAAQTQALTDTLLAGLEHVASDVSRRRETADCEGAQSADKGMRLKSCRIHTIARGGGDTNSLIPGLVKHSSGSALNANTPTIEHQRVALHTQRLLIRWSFSPTKVRKRILMF
ncbi:hypothetical protein B0A48_11118 [Cryoendolithus antarcticus]|uniref:Uncharacterized protein n=1 Tax=Cryoendolithus antarcticus TaxID=1507870 RepID=A0A1V8SUH6_9PEZI|nr:hypothetical protein B0A48_11118 [Cryoendolithus antarcticus]